MSGNKDGPSIFKKLRGDVESLKSIQSETKSLRNKNTDKIRQVTGSIKELLKDADARAAIAAVTAFESAEDTQISETLDGFVDYLEKSLSGELDEAARILVVDDDPEIGKVVAESLGKERIEVICAGTAKEAVRLLNSQSFSLVVLDLVLPYTDGRQLLAAIRKSKRTRHVPVVMLSVKGSALSAECFALGADDYFEKPIDPVPFAFAVVSRIIKSARGSVVEQSFDRLPAREEFEAAFEKKNSEQSGKPLAVALIAIDHLGKLIQDYGERACDDIFSRISQISQGQLKSKDVVAELSEGVIGILFPDTDSEGAKRAIQRILDAIKGEVFEASDGRVIDANLSAGVIDVVPEQSFDDAYNAAERYLFFARTLKNEQTASATDKIENPNKKILLAEDDAVIATVVKHCLGKEDFEVTHFTDGSMALDAARSQDYSLILLDVFMPGMDGFDVLEHIRKEPSLSGTPVIMITSCGSDDFIERGFRQGADDYITKPFSTVELVARVRRMFEKM